MIHENLLQFHSIQFWSIKQRSQWVLQVSDFRRNILSLQIVFVNHFVPCRPSLWSYNTRDLLALTNQITCAIHTYLILQISSIRVHPALKRLCRFTYFRCVLSCDAWGSFCKYDNFGKHSVPVLVSFLKWAVDAHFLARYIKHRFRGKSITV